MVLAKNLKFRERFVLCKIHPGKVFGDVLVRKQAFLDNINMDLKAGKIDKIDQEKVSGNVLVKQKGFYNPLQPPVTPCQPLSPLVTPCNPL